MKLSKNYAAPSSIGPWCITLSHLWLDFEWDTILIDDNTPPFINSRLIILDSQFASYKI
ncbi:MAG: hypothetical protein R2788_12280 [Saprospiraceae bacterium]